MNIRDLIYEKQAQLTDRMYGDTFNTLNSINNDLEMNEYTEEELLFESIDYSDLNNYMEDALHDYSSDLLKIFGEDYTNSLILESVINEASLDELDIIEESVKDSFVEFKNNVVDKIKELWARFKAWIKKLIASIKDFIFGDDDKSSSDEKTDSKKDDVEKFGSDDVEILGKKSKSGGKSSGGKSDDYIHADFRVMPDDEGGHSKSSSSQKGISHANRKGLKSPQKKLNSPKKPSNTQNKIKQNDTLLRQRYDAKKNTLTFQSYVYKNNGDKILKTIMGTLTTVEWIADHYVRSNSYTSKDYYRKVFDRLSKDTGHSVTKKEDIKLAISLMVRDGEKKQHKLGDLDLETIKYYAGGATDFFKTLEEMDKDFDDVFSTTIKMIQQEQENKEFIKNMTDICKAGVNISVYTIKVSVSEMKSAVRACRQIVKHLVK